MELVTVGIPVYNSVNTIEKTLKCILEQTHANLEVIISDNNSNDGTSDICEAYAKRDRRIRYVKQEKNIGMNANFKYVLQEAAGEFFTWNAADDQRSLDFIKINVNFLRKNKDFIASTSPNFFEGEEETKEKWVAFDIQGLEAERILKFFEICWSSHGLFYSVMQTKYAKEFKLFDRSFLGLDWAFNIYLLKKGNIRNLRKGYICLGKEGLSMSRNPWKPFRNKLIHWILPLYDLSIYAFKLIENESLRSKFQLLKKIFSLNMICFYGQLRTELRVLLKT